MINGAKNNISMLEKLDGYRDNTRLELIDKDKRLLEKLEKFLAEMDTDGPNQD